MPRSKHDHDKPDCAARRGRPRSDDVAQRIESLLEAASVLFVRHGYANVSLETIARDAHVAVRTIYVKFGGKAGLFNAVVARERDRFLDGVTDLEVDRRPIDEVLADFGVCFLNLMLSPHVVRVQRIVIGEVDANPELGRTFFEAGPAQTRQILMRYFARPDVRARFRAGLSEEQLAVHFSNCLLGDQVSRILFDPVEPVTTADIARQVAHGLALFIAGAQA
jgi:TetR/AcrR family transcriptional repressor of mexJK operon